MSAEGNLYNPAVFLPPNRLQALSYRASLSSELQASLAKIDAGYLPSSPGQESDAFIPIMQMSEQYLAIVQHLKTQTAISAVKAHLFRLWKPIFGGSGGSAGTHHDVRDALSMLSSVQPQSLQGWQAAIQKFVDLTGEMKQRLEVSSRRKRCTAIASLPMG